MSDQINDQSRKQNAIERAVTLTSYEKLVIDDFPEKIKSFNKTSFTMGDDEPSELLPMEKVERKYIQHVLKKVDGNKALAARILGFDRKTLYRKLNRKGDFADRGHQDGIP